MSETTVTYTGGEVEVAEDVQEPERRPIDEIRLRTTPERIADVDLLDWLGARRGEPDAIIKMAVHFMTNGQGEYVTPQEARVILRQLKLGDLGRLNELLLEAINEGAAPKANG